MSRQNAARLERLIAVNTGNLDPQKAADFLNRIREQITNASNEVVKESIFSNDGFFEGGETMNWTLRPVISICDFGYIEFFVKRKKATIFAYRDKWSCEELGTIDVLSIEEAQLKAEVVISDYLLIKKELRDE